MYTMTKKAQCLCAGGIVLAGLFLAACPLQDKAARYAITIQEARYGAVSADQASAQADEIVTLNVFPFGGYRLESLHITPDMPCDGNGSVRVFAMPAADVSINAVFVPLPLTTRPVIERNFYRITIADNIENGKVSISGIETEGEYAGKAQEGAVVTVTVQPDPGYKPASAGIAVLPADAAAVYKVENMPAWTFTMADQDVEISVEFTELGPLDIYRGAARKGITKGALPDDVKYYENCIDLESSEGGRNGNLRAVKIIHAEGPGGGTAQQSFGLFSDTEIDLSSVSALSFWAKANKALNIRYIGFGDDEPDKRVVYTGENNNQAIPLTTEWRRYIIPVPAPVQGQKTKRVFFLNAALSRDNYVLLDDIEFISTSVNITGIEIIDVNPGSFYGATEAVNLLRGVPLKLTYRCDDGTTAALQASASNHTLKYNPAAWLAPYIRVSGDVDFQHGVIVPQKETSNLSLRINLPSIASDTMHAVIFDGLVLDDFEDFGNQTNAPIPGNPAAATGYLWHTTSTGSVVVARDFITAANNEIHSGLASGNWRSTATANKPRGGRNFEAKDANGFNTLTFWIKVTSGGNIAIQKNTVFTFELRNGGTRDSKTDGVFFTRQFTYEPDNADGWQQIKMPLSAFIADGFDISAITGYAIGIVDNRGQGLRVMLDDIAVVSNRQEGTQEES